MPLKEGSRLHWLACPLGENDPFSHTSVAHAFPVFSSFLTQRDLRCVFPALFGNNRLV